VGSALVEAGADLNAHAAGMWHHETPLHWAASNDDVELIDALLDAGADIEHPGSSISGGPPSDSALGYAQWKALRRLYERGAAMNLSRAAALGLMPLVTELARATPAPDGEELAAWARTGAAVRLIEADFDHRALLLERVRPGTHLPGNDPGAIGVAAGLLGALHRAPLPASSFPALRDSLARMERQARRDAEYEQRARNEPGRGQSGLRRLPVARAAAARLCAGPAASRPAARRLPH